MLKLVIFALVVVFAVASAYPSLIAAPAIATTGIVAGPVLAAPIGIAPIGVGKIIG